MADLSTPIKCKACTKPFVRKQGRETYCPECAKTPKCGGCKWRGGLHSPNCPRSKGGKPKKATGGGTRRPPPPEPVVASNGTGKTTAYIRGLVQSVAAGKAAEVELASIREAGGW